MNKRLSILIILYEENFEIIEKCLSKISEFKIIIIDNANDQSLKDKIIKNFIIYKFFLNKKNIGFSIAANDLDIRGSGNIIGAEQSGHIKEVGIELYYKMLNETISELKNEKKVDSDWSPSINLGFSFNIPDNYIVNLDIRMQIYRRISGIERLIKFVLLKQF